MPTTDTSVPESSSSRPAAIARRVSAVRMPIEAPVENTEAAVEQLRQCSSAELRRARRHHRRALEALRNGGYSNLSDATRERLTDQLRNNLEAINRALATGSDANPPSESTTSQDDDSTSSFSARVRAFFQALW
jgi:hypothetical protein